MIEWTTVHENTGVWIAYARHDADKVMALCKGERHAHIAPGKWLQDSHFRGSTADNWHGGPTGSLEQLMDWCSEAYGTGCELWEPFSMKPQHRPTVSRCKCGAEAPGVNFCPLYVDDLEKAVQSHRERLDRIQAKHGIHR